MDNLLPREYMFYNIFLFLPTNLTIFLFSGFGGCPSAKQP